MIIRFAKIFSCALLALFVGMVAIVAVDAVSSPSKWSRPGWPWDVALVEALLYVVPPLTVLVLVAMLRGIPSTSLSVIVAVGWLTAVFAWWAVKPWMDYGEFPWWAFKRNYLNVLPIPLSFGLTFSLCTRVLLGPNKRFNRDTVQPYPLS